MTTTSSVACIDIGAFLAGRDEAATAAAVADACASIGFLQIVGHGIEPELLDAVYDAIDEVGALPDAVKDRFASPTGHPFRGLLRYARSDGMPSVERFQVNHFDGADEAMAAGVPEVYADYFVPNVWVEAVPALRTAVEALFARMQRLGAQLMALFERSLALPPGTFTDIVEPNVSTFAVNRYPSRPSGRDDAPVVLLAQHADSGTLTILHQRGSYDGLEILEPDGVWAKVPRNPDAFVVNIGELMGRWTNGAWTPTVHRVVSSAEADDWRTTLTTFHLPAIDCTVAPLPTCVGDGEPRYGAVTPYEWESMYLSARSAYRS
jgi:isopenicillin N synthase-like dioxygenase